MSLDRFPMIAGRAAIALAILLPLSAYGYEFRLVPSLAAREEYNSNLFFTNQDQLDTWRTTVTPGLEAAGKTERLDAALSGNVSQLWYSADSGLDDWNFDAKGRIAYRFTPVFRVSGTGQYGKSSIPDRFFETTGVVVGAIASYRQYYTALAEYSPSEKALASLSYAFERLDYPDRPLQGGDTHAAGLGFSYNLSRFARETKARLDLGFGRGLYEGLTVNNYKLTVGVSRSVHELWSAQVNVGGRYTTSQFDILGVRQETNDTGWVGDASLVYTGEFTNASFTFSSNIAPAYSSSGAVLRTAAVLNLSRRLLHELSGTFAAGYYWNRADAGQFSYRNVDDQSARLRPGLQWKATKDIVLDAAYQYSWYDNKVAGGGKAVQNVFYAGVNLSHPFFE